MDAATDGAFQKERRSHLCGTTHVSFIKRFSEAKQRPVSSARFSLLGDPILAFVSLVALVNLALARAVMFHGCGLLPTTPS